MKIPNRDLLVLLRKDNTSQSDIEQEVESIHEMLGQVESVERFCEAHELAERRGITSRPKRILRAIQSTELKPFTFLINRN